MITYSYVMAGRKLITDALCECGIYLLLYYHLFFVVNKILLLRYINAELVSIIIPIEFEQDT